MALYRILAFLAPAHNDHFTTLVLPTAITIDPLAAVQPLLR